jgi:hypothetical protein
MFVLDIDSTFMEVFTLKDDLKVFCVTAKYFPYGIRDAYETLKKKLPDPNGRTFLGISFLDEESEIIYKAAVLESFEGEAEHSGCEIFMVPKGEYLAETLKNWREDETIIGITFRKLADSRMDTTFPCIEWYQGDYDVICMIKLFS